MSTGFSSRAEEFAKKAEEYPSIFGDVNLLGIRQKVQEILKLIGRDGIFREYTLHDINHIDALLALVDKLVPPDTANKMRVADWLLIVLSCYFHDLGMLVTKQEYTNRHNSTAFADFTKDLLSGDKGKDYQAALEPLDEHEREEFLYQEFVRKHHARRISDWISGQDSGQYGDARGAVEAVNKLLSSLEQVVRDDLAKICLSHHEDDLFDFQKYKINRVYGDSCAGEANLHYAALILRAADVLQIQKKRVPTVLYKLIDPSNPKSQEEWAKQAGVRAIKPRMSTNGTEADIIEVHASFDKESAYFGLLAYVHQYAAKEIARCASWAADALKAGSTYRFPWRVLDTSQVEPRGFEGRTYAFTLDQEKILTLLTGHTLYNDARVAVREVLQNALDSVRFRKHQFPDEPIGEIEVTWNPKTRELAVRDSGTGMTQEIIEKFLLNVGASFYQSDAVIKRYETFSPISRFGIGILSTFMIADEVQILTVHPDDKSARQLTLPSVVRSYLVKKFSKGDPSVRAIGPHGTMVTLHVRRSVDLENVVELVRHWMVIPQCKVTCIVDGSAPVQIGFPNAKAALEYYYGLSERNGFWVRERETRVVQDNGIQLAYMVSTSKFVDTWEFVTNRHKDRGGDDENAAELATPPGICIEGVRVSSTPPGFHNSREIPWILLNLTGRNAPRTNVARSDLEQSPELDRVTARVYELLGTHAETECARLMQQGCGITEAAHEAEIILRDGLNRTSMSSPRLFDQATADLRVIALEDTDVCKAVSRRELESFDEVWTIDSSLLWNAAGICGRLGINLPADVIITKLGGKSSQPIPTPRYMGYDVRTLQAFEVAAIHAYPEGRSVRLDLCWRKKQSRWTVIPPKLLRRLIARRSLPITEIWITKDKSISATCPDFDVIKWRNICMFLATSPVQYLLDAFGLSDLLVRWICCLLEVGRVPDDERPLLRAHLAAANVADPDAVLARMSIPEERQFNDYLWRRHF